MHKDKRVEKKKTVVMKRCLNPVFNESFPFDVPAHVLRETTIIITVMDKDRLSRNDVIGKVSSSLLLHAFLLLLLLTLWQTISSSSLSQSLLTPAGTVFCIKKLIHAQHMREKKIIIIILSVDGRNTPMTNTHGVQTKRVHVLICKYGNRLKCAFSILTRCSCSAVLLHTDWKRLC